MHSVLQNTFLLREIFDHLGEADPEACIVNIECYPAALVCRAFRNPAQDILWRHLVNIKPLLQLLPTFKLEKTSDTWIFEGDITASDLETLQRFGRRVRTLSCTIASDNYGNEVQLHSSVPTILANALSGQPLLPNLQNLDFLQHHEGKYICGGFLHLLHSTQLRAVSLWHIIDNEEEQEPVVNFVDYSSFISRLHKASSLHTLRTHGFLLSEAAQKAVGSFRNLSTLSFNMPIYYGVSLRWEFFTSISVLQNLRSLEIHFCEFDNGGITLEPGFQVELSGLQSLSISSTFPKALGILQTSRLPALQEFTWSLQHPDDQQLGGQLPWTALFKAMSVSFGHDFTRLEAAPTRRSFINVNSYTGVPFSSISRHLLPMRLREIKLTFPLIESISIDDLDQISKAWPTLTTLHILTSSTISAPNTSALSFIAQNFPQLMDLSLRVDTENILKPPGTASFHKLGRIALRPIKWAGTNRAERQLASLLDSLFPYLKSANLVHPRRTDYNNELFERIFSLQEARKRQRQQMLQSAHDCICNRGEDVQGDLNVEMEG